MTWIGIAALLVGFQTGPARVVEGTVEVEGGGPVAGATVAFGPVGNGIVMVRESVVTADDKGAFRADLSRFPWATGTVRAMACVRDHQVSFRDVDLKAMPAKPLTLRVIPQPWKVTEIRLTSRHDLPTTDVEVGVTLLGTIPLPGLRTDEDGRCRVALPEDLPGDLRISPKGGRRIDVSLPPSVDRVTSLTIPVQPPLRGKVYDADGKPAAGFSLGTSVYLDEPNPPLVSFMRSRDEVKTGPDGQFEFAPPVYYAPVNTVRANPRLNHALVAFDPATGRFVHTLYNTFDTGDPIVLQIKPLRRVRIKILKNELASAAGLRAYADWSVITDPLQPKGRASVWSRRSQTTSEKEMVIEESLPPGKYELEVSLNDPAVFNSSGIKGQRKTIVQIPEGTDPLELPPLTLEPPAEFALVGKLAPEIRAVDLDTGKPVTLAEYRGKAVILEFWGYWCGPCIAGSFPKLIELKAKLAGQPFEVLAVHDQSIQSRADYEKRLASARERLWGGKDLPFRVALDRPDPAKPEAGFAESSGATIATYQVRAFPTVYLIAPDGKVAGQFNFTETDRMEKAIRDLLNSKPQAPPAQP